VCCPPPPPPTVSLTRSLSPSFSLYPMRGMASAHLETSENKRKKKGKKKKGKQKKRAVRRDVWTPPHSGLPVFIVVRAFTYIAPMADCISAMREVRTCARARQVRESLVTGVRKDGTQKNVSGKRPHSRM